MDIERFTCQRCEERPATRFGRAQVLTSERGVRWQDVGLCERCASLSAAPPVQRSTLGVDGYSANTRRN